MPCLHMASTWSACFECKGQATFESGAALNELYSAFFEVTCNWKNAALYQTLMAAR